MLFQGRGWDVAARESDKTKVWFEYVRTTGRYTAWPICWQGWVAMIVLIPGPILGAVALSKVFPQVPPMMFGLSGMALCFATFFPLTYFKGRPSKRSGV